MATSSRKATDLERLTQPGGKVMPDDATIPVLTERLTLPSLDLDISLPRPPPPVVAPVTPPPPAVAEPTSPPAARPAPPPSTLFASVASVAPVFAQPSYRPAPAPVIEAAKPAIDWQKIETQLRESLLRELQPQLSAELERQVRERLQPTLVRALTALISDLRPALDTTVRETISRAISAEFERQRSALK
jgi:hypothetical protein